MRFSSVIFVLALMFCASRTPAATLEDLKKLAAAGQHEQVIAQADSVTSQAGGWNTPLGRSVPNEAYFGKKFGYLRFLMQTQPPAAPVPPSAMPGTGAHADFVTCFDLQTGKLLWTRALQIDGRSAIDPRDDSLWSWNERFKTFEQCDPTGTVRKQGALTLQPGTGFPGPLECLRDGDTDIWATKTIAIIKPGLGDRYNLATNKVEKDVPRPLMLSADGTLMAANEFGRGCSVTVSPAPGSKAKAAWKKEFPLNTHVATWAGGDVLVYEGSDKSAAVLHCFKGATGEPKWKSPLQGNGFSPNANRGGWATVGTLGKEVWAIDGRFRLYFFDAATGKPGGQVNLGGQPIATPVFDGSDVIVATFTGVRKVSLDDMQRDEMAEAMTLKLKSLVALKRGDEALNAAGEATARLGTPASWEALAEVFTALDQPRNAIAARVNGLLASGATESATFKQSHGLQMIVPTGPVKSPLLALPPVVVVGDMEGIARKIDPQTGKITATDNLEKGISWLRMDGQKIVAICEDANRWAFAPAGTKPELRLLTPPGRRPGEEPYDATDVDRQWHTVGGGISPVQRLGTRLYRTTSGGGVRELVKKQVVIREGKVPTLEDWRIAQVGKGLMGFGKGGVYTVDNNLVAGQPVIELPKNESGREQVALGVAADEQTLAVVVQSDAECRVDVHSRDGKTLIRSTTMAPLHPFIREPGRIKPVAGGYVVAGAELLFVPADPAKPERRFTSRMEDTRERKERTKTPRPWMRQKGISYLPPEIVGNALVVASSEGGVYVFDLAAFTAAK